jgi:uncharacterized protein YceH (UPF0502 family)
MSLPQPGSGAEAPWPVLDTTERRVLGVLVEKAKTTPDAYPMSLNSLVTGSNQKSNRDPLLNLTDVEVEEALGRCQKKGLVMRITGGRVERWRHLLYEAWRVDKVEISILAELLVRGPQTEGELRTRASRMEPIEDLETLRNVLRPLVERGLVVYLTAEERRGAMLTHGFHDPRERERLRAHAAAAFVPPEPQTAVATPAAPSPPSRAEQVLPTLEAEVVAARQEAAAARAEGTALRQTVDELRATVGALQAEVRALKQALGV